MRFVPGPETSTPDLLHWAIEMATHAPSKHNAQPWRFDVDGGVVTLHADGARAMPVSDPTGRELVVGCGAALYTLLLALRSAGREPVTTLFPEGPGFSVLARVAVGPAGATTQPDLAMLDAVLTRHTDRGPLDGEALSPRVPFLLQDAAEAQGTTLQLLMTPGLQQTLAALVGRADRVESTDERWVAEIREWVRPDDGHDDGIPLAARGPGAAGSYRAKFVQRDFDVTGEVHGTPTDIPEDRPLPAVLWTDGDHPVDWLRAGMGLAAVLLRATTLGVHAGFLNQALEIPAMRAKLRQELALPGFPQAVLRLGAGTDGAPTPRRPVEDVTSGLTP